MFNLTHSHASFHGGCYTQVNNIQNHNPSQQRIPWDHLQSAVAPSAFYDSGDNFDAPKCHPNTRVAVINELCNFFKRRGDTGHKKLLWLNGAAGAGKSAIVRTLCEKCAATNSLLASFFFNRSDASRNHHKTFVATITYQVYGCVPPHHQSLILGVIERDPLVFTRSIDAQFQALIVRPLFDLFENGYFSAIGKRLVAIDGLDECSTTAAQLDILKAIQKISNQAEFPFIFLISSRPEHEIQTFFRASSVVHLLHRLELDDSYLPDVDIERFLVDKLQETRATHPFKSSIPHIWPSGRSIRALVHKSSGQFIYASVVVKYVTSTRHQPHKRLDYVLNLRPPKGDLPFAELDALYSQILSCAQEIDLALRIIGCSISSSTIFTLEQLTDITRLDMNDCLAALCDFWSVLSIEADCFGRQRIQVSHQSFPEYLFDSTRSGKYHLNETQVASELMAKCFWYISNVIYSPASLPTRYNVITFWHRHSQQLISSIDSSHDDLMSFSLIDCYNTFASRNARSDEVTALFNEIFWDNFLFSLLNHLNTLVGSEYAHVYHHYLDQFRKLITHHPQVYRPALTKFQQRIAALVTVLILAEQSSSESFLNIFELVPRSSLARPDLIPYPNWFLAGHMKNLLHDAALQCFKFLSTYAGHNSVAHMLRYLTWVLPYAAESPELKAACSREELFAYTVTPGTYVLSSLTLEVATAMQEYRRRCLRNQAH